MIIVWRSATRPTAQSDLSRTWLSRRNLSGPRRIRAALHRMLNGWSVPFLVSSASGGPFFFLLRVLRRPVSSASSTCTVSVELSGPGGGCYERAKLRCGHPAPPPFKLVGGSPCAIQQAVLVPVESEKLAPISFLKAPPAADGTSGRPRLLPGPQQYWWHDFLYRVSRCPASLVVPAHPKGGVVARLCPTSARFLARARARGHRV